MTLKDINIDFSFTSDTPNYWDGFWAKDFLRGGGAADPDSKSPMLKEYHQLLWSRTLPNGQKLELVDGKSWSYLKTPGKIDDDARAFGSDSIIVSMRQRLDRTFLQQIKESLPDYQKYIEDFVLDTYTIGGMVIFPQIKWSMNQARGCSRKICDRWDLTLECIRRYYSDGLCPNNPLYKSLAKDRNREFFDSFIDFKGYIDFFFFQDWVSEDYSKIKIWREEVLFEATPLPRTVDEYFDWMQFQRVLLQKRNQRIKNYCLYSAANSSH